MGTKVEGRDTKRGTKAKKTISNASGNPKAPTGKSEPVFENPLVPNLVLRQMYQKMVETRLLGEHALRLGRKSKGAAALKSTYGQEACRVSLTQGLGPSDIVLDSQQGGLMRYLLGSPLPEVLSSLKVDAGDKKLAVGKAKAQSAGLLPFVEEAEERLFTGLGAALLLKQLKRTDAVVIFVGHKEVSNGTWRRALSLAAAQDLPVIFVVLAGTKLGKDKGKAGVSDVALSCGVPGIPVDASDAVALYRVAQESMGRIRSGEGSVLIEGIPFPADSKPKEVADPVEMMKGYLLHRQVSTEAELAQVEKDFRKRLAPRGK